MVTVKFTKIFKQAVSSVKGRVFHFMEKYFNVVACMS